MKYYVFPKNFQQLSLQELMQTVATCGFDGPTALIRDGYWLDKSNVVQQLPVFVKAAQEQGLEVKYASADISPESLVTCEKSLDLLKCMAANGIEQVRLQHVVKRPEDDVRTYARRFRRQAYCAVQAGEKAGLQCVIQLHGMCYPHNATAAYQGVQGLPSEYVGIKMDPGNNRCQEGYETFDYQVRLLGEYLCAMGAKDVGWVCDGNKETATKGWRQEWLPANSGLIDYHEIFVLLKQQNFQGPIIQMPFYSGKTHEDFVDLVAKELAYLKQCEKEA